MPTTPLATLRTGPVATLIAQGAVSLWILDGAATEDIEALSSVPWVNVWNTHSTIDYEHIHSRLSSSRQVLLVSSIDRDVAEFSRKKFLRVYQYATTKTESKQLQQFRSMQLKSQVSTTVGVLVIVGPVSLSRSDIQFIREAAPHLILLCVDTSGTLGDVTDLDMFQWSKDAHAFREEAISWTNVSQGNLVNLKDAPNVSIDPELVEAIEEGWTLLTNDKVSATPISQNVFDSFLNGDPEWSVFATGGARERAFAVPAEDRRTSHHDRKLSEVIASVIESVEQTDVDPRDPLRQVRIFAEPGSGSTTSLRAAGIIIAQLGYPVLISNPSPPTLAIEAISQLIINVQDQWRVTRSGTGSGRGNIPVVILLDKDVEEEREPQRLVRVLAGLGRSAILVRTYERSGEEIERASNVISLTADINETEMLAIGSHLRRYCISHSLSPVPSDSEWRAYHAGLTHMLQRREGETEKEEVPYLFLVGLHAFVSERIRDINSLEQYYFHRWEQLETESLKSLVQILAAAGVYNITIPYDSLRRVQEVDLAQIETTKGSIHRILDVFVRWHDRSRSTRTWHLRIRHPIVGRLLSRSISPLEGDWPYSCLLPLLKVLTTKPEDMWFAEELVTRVGKSFKRRAARFSLESDTPTQRAARAVFNALPKIVKDASRVITHHEARYHMHVVHACLDALEQPDKTRLQSSAIHRILDEEYKVANSLLENALTLQSNYERDSNIYNTHAALLFNLADAASEDKTEAGIQQFAERLQRGINLQEQAIVGDPADALARYQFVNQIFDAVPASEFAEDEKLNLYARAELRLEEILKLHQEKRLRNIDPVDAEVQIGTLFSAYEKAFSSLPSATAALATFHTRNPEAALLLMIRRVLGAQSLQDGFARGGSLAEDLVGFRNELLELPRKSPRTLLYLYRMFVDDPRGRLEFDVRLKILSELRQQSPEQHLAYWHDDASLLCQLDNFRAGAERFRELRAFRKNGKGLWFWTNEHALLQQGYPAKLREMTFVVRDPSQGHAEFKDIGVNIRYQPYQFLDYKRDHVFGACVRFTLAGMQAVPQNLARADLIAMGLK